MPSNALAADVLRNEAVMVADPPAVTFSFAPDAVDATVAAPAGPCTWPEAAVTVIRLSTPSPSSQVTPSTTGRSRSAYVPGIAGARTRKEKVAASPGATADSIWVAT